MPVSGSGFTEPPRDPTLDELVAILRVATNTKFEYSFVDETITVSFKVSKKDCADAGIHVNTTNTKFFGALHESLERLQFFHEVVREYVKPEAKGATSDDCISFLNNELRHIVPNDLHSQMQRRMFNTIIKKLTELREWRVFADKERFERMRREQEEIRRQHEQMREQARRQQERAAEEEAKRRKAKQEQTGKQKTAEEDFARAFQDEFSRFWGGDAGPKRAFTAEELEELMRKFGQNHYHNPFGGASFYDNFGSQDFQRKRPGSFNFGKKRWFEILGVEIKATRAEIKSAWRKLAKQYHPDRNK